MKWNVMPLAAGAILLQGAIAGCTSMQVEPEQGEAPETAVAEAASGAHGEVSFEGDIAPLLTSYCVSCHSGASPQASVGLQFASEEAAREKLNSELDFWERVSRNIEAEQMPPAYAPNQPTEEERALLVDWINDHLMTRDGQRDPGPFMVRRLNNREYEKTVRDLLYLPDDFDVSGDFPADGRGDGGFDNNAGTLTISPLLIENYLNAARNATVTALGLHPDVEESRDTLSSRLALIEPSTRVEEVYEYRVDLVRENLRAFVPRAFRRPVTDEEVEELMKFADLAFSTLGNRPGLTRDEALALAIRATLLSPEFLFRVERDPSGASNGDVFELSEYQLASRLSYFLWSTMPDEELFRAAREETLRENLDEHVVRMLKDPKARSLTEDFLGQWLQIRSLDEGVSNVPGPLAAAMKAETEHFFDYIVQEDRSVMDFLDADYTFVNEPLAELYGIEGVEGDEFRRVEVDPSQRGGIFTQASFLTLTSKPLGDSRRTSPVVRGMYIMEQIFGQEIPPPPPDVPEVEFDGQEELKGTTREIFEQHRADPSCAGCHARMDPYGFALENYDGYGRWRDVDNGAPIDPSGEIEGESFRTPVEFREVMSEREDDFRRALTQQMLSYALGRGIRGSDRATLEEITEAMQEEGDTFSSLIINIAKSYPFQHARSSPAMTAEVPDPADEPEELFHPYDDPRELEEPDSDEYSQADED